MELFHETAREEKMEGSQVTTIKFNTNKDPRKSKRVLANFPVKCKVVSGITFQQAEIFRKSSWRCVNFSSHGITLQTQGRIYNRFLQKIRPILKLLSKRKVHYPPVPPRELGIGVVISVPGTKNSFTFYGRLVWFRPLWTDVYRMGIKFDGPQQFIVHEHGDGNIYITTYFPKEVLNT